MLQITPNVDSFGQQQPVRLPEIKQVQTKRQVECETEEREVKRVRI
jgi:hypothetical protein